MRHTTAISMLIALIISSCTNKLTSNKYVAIEPWKEWEIELKFNKDSTFILIDEYGCNRFSYSGQWHYHNDSILAFIVLNDTTESEYIKSHDMFQVYDKKTHTQQVFRANEYFPVISNDTVWVLNKRQVKFRSLTFSRKKLLGMKNLHKERTKMLESYYIGKMGRELFIKTFGDGKGIKEARKNISDCKITSIPNEELNKASQH